MDACDLRGLRSHSRAGRGRGQAGVQAAPTHAPARWDQVEFGRATLHVRRVKQGAGSQPRAACGCALANKGTIRAHCKLILDTGIFSIQSGTPNYHRGSRIFGASERCANKSGSENRLVPRRCAAQCARWRQKRWKRRSGSGVAGARTGRLWKSREQPIGPGCASKPQEAMNDLPRVYSRGKMPLAPVIALRAV